MTVTRPDDDTEYAIVLIQNVAESTLVGTHRILADMARRGAMGTVPCSECGRDGWCAVASLRLALPHPYPVCLGCIGAAMARFKNLDRPTIDQAHELARTYQAMLAEARITEDPS